ncbi:MAG TPA: MFS transporter [Puia sp.]|nr:MFS transporter [Puia sp.]
MKTPSAPFSSYQKIAIALLAVTQFTVILDFMVISPLGDFLMKSLNLHPHQFGLAVSVYAFSAGASGLLTAGFADRFDRKKLLLFFYTGFIAGTVLCGLSHSYEVLLAARLITGLFGGVIGSISLAIVTDLFSFEQRGRAMSFIQMGFSASSVLGIPIGIYLATIWSWQATFLMVAGLAILTFVLISFKMQPVNKHLGLQRDRSALSHLYHTIAKRNYRIGFSATAFMAIGGFMMMPFGSAFAINNLGVTPHELPLLFMVSGISSLGIMPLVGKMSDKYDKYTIFVCAAVFMMIFVVIYTHLSVSPLWYVMIFNVVMMAGIFSRIIPATALTTAIPDVQDRGAFMSVNASLQQIAGGVAAGVAGMIIVQKDKHSPLEHYDWIGYVMVIISFITIILMYRVNAMIKAKSARPREMVQEIPV